MSTIQITIAPRCPECGSADCGVYKSQGMSLNHDGQRCRAIKQYRKCQDCGHGFTVIHIKGPVSVVSRMRRNKLEK